MRRDDLSQYGFYNPLDNGGYMMTVSFLPLSSTLLHSSLAVVGLWCPFSDTATLLSGATPELMVQALSIYMLLIDYISLLFSRFRVLFVDSTSQHSGRLDLESPLTRFCPPSRTRKS